MFPRVAFLTQGPAGPLPFPETVMLPIQGAEPALEQRRHSGHLRDTTAPPARPLGRTDTLCPQHTPTDGRRVVVASLPQ